MKRRHLIIGVRDNALLLAAFILFASSLLSGCGKEENIPVQGIALDRTKISMVAGDSRALSATVLPESATNKTVFWECSNETVVVVDNGTVTALSEGSAIVKAITEDGGKTSECTVNVVSAPIPVDSVSLDNQECSIGIGETVLLVATVYPEDATDQELTWSSENETVASIDNTGLVTGKSKGTTVITVATKDGGKEATCTVTVTGVSVEGIRLDKTSASIKVGETLKLNVEIIPEDADNKNMSWASSDEAVATVEDGVVTAMSEGTSLITVTTEDGEKMAACEITVVTHNVYVAGFEFDDAGEGNYFATVWKNGEKIRLSDDYSMAYSVYCHDGNMYVGGDYYTGWNTVWYASLWKNREEEHLSGTNSIVEAVFVSENGDVYATGHETEGETQVATLWKNGEPQRLSLYYSTTTDVHVSQGDVYVTGHEIYNAQGWYHGILWKNGVPQVLENIGWGSFAQDVYVDGNDVYVAGREFDDVFQLHAVLWKNGVRTRLSENSSQAMCVVVSDGNVYVAGWDTDDYDYSLKATLWVNGVPQRVGGPNSYARSVVVVDGDIYMAGYEWEEPQHRRRAIYWKNGEKISLPHVYSSEGHDIFID